MKTKFIVMISIILILIANVVPIYAQSEETSGSVKAKVVENKGTEEVKQENGVIKKIQKTEVRILDGEYENEEYEMEYVLSESSEELASNLELKEDDNILVEIEEEEGEVITINYKETINKNYILYIVLAISVILILIIGRQRAIKPIIMYLLTIGIIGGIFVFSMQNAWNFVLISSIISVLITIVVLFSANGMNKRTIAMLICVIMGIIISGILMYLLFDIMNLTDVNIKITKKLINVKELLCGTTILVSCGICNIIILFVSKMFLSTKESYKTKSDNIIEGQRSLKL